MRAPVLALLLLVGLGAGAWLLLGERPADQGPGPLEAGPGAAPTAEPAPRLIGSAEGTPSLPRDLRGTGSVQGTVWRHDTPVAAQVELRLVAALDATNPGGRGAAMVMIARMLDAGVSSGAVAARTGSGADGTWRFDGLAPGLYEVRAVAADGAAGFASAWLPAPGARVRADVDLPVGTLDVRGRVVHADGTPFHGLVVASSGERVAMMMGGGAGAQVTSTDAAGRFALHGLSPGTVLLSALVPGVLRVMAAPLVLPHDEEVLITLDAGAVRLRGRVVRAADDGPVAGASVLGGGGDPATGLAIHTATTDDDGRFELALPGAAQGGVFVEAAGYATQAVEVHTATDEEIVVSLVALAAVSGRVVTAGDGTPVRDVTVVARSRRRERFGGPSLGRTDAQGRFALEGVSPGAVELVALGAGWVSSGVGNEPGQGYTPDLVELEPGASAEVEIRVGPAGGAAGRVTAPDGGPVPGCVVRVEPPLLGGGRGDLALGSFGAGPGTAVTDADGRYALPTLVPGRACTLLAEAPEHAPARSAAFTPAAGRTETVDLAFAPVRRLALRVVAAEGGAPVAGARVRLEGTGGSAVRVDAGLRAPATWVTDADGRAAVGPLPAGTAKVVVTADGFAETGAEVDEGAPAPKLVLELPAGLVIAGRVASPEGVALEGLRVTVETDWGAMQASRSYVHLQPPVAADGSFRVDTLAEPGTYRVSARARHGSEVWAASAVLAAGTQDAVLTLAPPAPTRAGEALRVRVLDADGRPVLSGRIQLQSFQDGGGRSTLGRRLGGSETRFEATEPDRERWIEVWDLVGTASGCTIHGPIERGATEVEVHLPRGRAIAGRVLGPDGQGVRGVRVTAQAVHPSPRAERGEDHGEGVTDTDGRFEVTGLGDLDYALRFVTPPAFAPAPEVVAAAGARDVEVRLQGGVEATLTVLDEQGQPLPGAQVALLPARSPASRPSSGPVPNPAGRRPAASADAAGRATLRGVDPEGVFDLHVQPPSGREDLRAFREAGWRPRDRTIALGRAFAVTGRVQDQRGQPVVGCWVQHRPAGQTDFAGSVQTDASGRFEIQGLAAGGHELHARVPGITRRMDPSVSAVPLPTIPVAAGARDVVLTVDLGESLSVRVRDLVLGDRGGRWQSSAQLVSQAESPTQVYGMLDAQGRATFRGLVAGTAYTLWIAGLPGGRYVLQRDLVPGPDAIDVDAQPGGTIRGRLVGPTGRPATMQMVVAQRADGFFAPGEVDPATGRFSIPGLPPGPWTVHGTATDGEVRWVGSAPAEVGADVTLELQAQRER